MIDVTQLGKDEEKSREQYRELFRYEIDPDSKKHINETRNLELEIGGDLFKSRIQNLVDRPVRPLKRSRPPKSAEWEAVQKHADAHTLFKKPV